MEQPVPSGAAEGEIEVPPSEHAPQLNMRIAITVALVSTVIAGIHLANEDAVISMHHAEVAALDTWNQYQAKRQREYFAGLASDQFSAQSTLAPEGRRGPVDLLATRYKKDRDKYKDDEKDLQEKAKGLEEQEEKLAHVHDRFDMADGALAVCLSILAITALTGMSWLLIVAWSFAALGVTVGIAGLLALHALG